MKLLDLMTAPWAILPETLAELQQIYATHLRGDKIDLQAVEARLGRPLANDQQRYELREGGVAVLSPQGVMAPKANLFMQVSGGISTQMLTQQLDSMRADPRVRSVVFAPDSPGGNVLGIPAAGKALAALAAEKPTVTVVEGVMASAMYWVGSASNATYISGETDHVGSIGVVQRLSWDAANPQSMELVRGRYKRLSVNGAPPSADVVAYHEAQMDYLYTLFVDTVAAHRGVSSEEVLERMADGRVFIGQQAIDAGLVDGVSTVDAMVEQLATNPDAFARPRRRKAMSAASRAPTPPMSASAGAAPMDDQPEKGTVMPQADNTPVSRESLERDHPSLFAQLRAEFTAAGAAAELNRVKAVLAEGEGLAGHAALVQRLALDGKTTGAEAAQQILAAERATLTQAAADHAADAPKPAKAAAAPDEKPGKTRAELAAEASAYAAEHKVDFVAACKALGIEA